MAAANTYVSIATQTLGSATASVTFSSVSGAYTDLVLIANPIKSSTGGDMLLQVNASTSGTLYSFTVLGGDGATAGSTRVPNYNYIYTDYYSGLSTAPTPHIINFMNYSNTTTYKTILMRANSAVNGVDAIVGLWRSTAAINEIKLYPTSGANFESGSTFSLYGILAAT